MRFLLLFLLTAYAFSCSAIVIQDNHVLFKLSDDDLPWPLPDVNNPGLMIIHGMHCFEELQKSVDNNENMTIMHYQHCQKIIARILHVLESNHQSIQVNPWICDTLKEDGIIQNTHTKDTNGISYGINYGINYISAPSQPPSEIANESQIMAYVDLMAFNFGNLLMKNWTDPALLNSKERVWLAKWEREGAVKLGAVSIFCQVDGDLEKIRKVLQ